jgi:hypothetical protein
MGACQQLARSAGIADESAPTGSIGSDTSAVTVNRHSINQLLLLWLVITHPVDAKHAGVGVVFDDEIRPL